MVLRALKEDGIAVDVVIAELNTVGGMLVVSYKGRGELDRRDELPFYSYDGASMRSRIIQNVDGYPSNSL